MLKTFKVGNMLCLKRSGVFGKLCKRTVKRCYSVVAVKSEEVETDIIIKDLQRVSKQRPNKVFTKKPQKPPFVKNLFLGTYDTDILTYPQVLEKEDVEKLDEDLEPVKEFFSRPVTKESLMNNLGELQLSGLQIPQEMGGRELNLTESCRFLEYLMTDSSVAAGLLNNELFGVQAVSKKGTETQKAKYLPLFSSGTYLSAFCVAEKANFDFKNVNTKAVLSGDKKTWVISGEKVWVVNGSNAELFIVLAQTESFNKLGLRDDKLTAFLVERNFGGITSTPCRSVGIERTDICNVAFNNTVVPAENLLGEVNDGESVVSSLLTEVRLGLGPACISLTKELLNRLTEYFTNNQNCPADLAKTDLVALKISQICSSLYAMESMTYLTTGLLDQYENQDCDVEAAIVKVFCSENLYKSTTECLDLIGTPAFMKEHWCNELHRNALSYVILNEANDSLKIIIALLGLQHAGVHLKEKVKRMRNPLLFPANALKRMFDGKRQIDDNPRLSLKLKEYLHPSSSIGSEWLEYGVLRLEFATETLLARYGPDVTTKHMDLKRLAAAVIDVYAMTAVLGRASRSYCIGLQHADSEILLANSFCLNAMERVKENVSKIWAGPYSTNDENYRNIAKTVFKSGQYFPVHPLTRNF